jgi:ATP-binding cassette subfamily B protein
MEQGRVIEQGGHRALLAQGGAYAAMWELQQREREAIAAQSGG